MKTLILTVGLLSAVAVGSQLLNATQDAGMPEMPEMDEMEMPQPTAQHRMLAKGVGVWDAALTFSDETGDQQMTGTEKVTMFGPFFQVADFSGEYMGTPFMGRATMGYDAVREEWVSTWVDSFSPSMQVMRGQYDEATSSVTFFYDGVNGMGEIQPGKSVITWTGDDSHTYEAYWLDAEGNGTRHMHIAYTRAKPAGMGGARTR